MINTWKMQRKNNKDDKKIHPIYKDSYNKMILYLRSSDINIYHQEYIRQDIISMILDGQERDAELKEIFGDDLKGFIDEVIDAAPKITKKQKVLETISSVLFLFPLYYVIGTVLYAIFEGFGQGFLQEEFHIGISNMMRFTFIILLTHLLIRNSTKNSFNPSKEGKQELFLFILYIIVNAIASFYLSKFDKQIFIKVKNLSYLIAMIICALLAYSIQVYVSREYNKGYKLI